MKNNVEYVTARVVEKKKLSKTIYLVKTKTLDKLPEPQPPQFVMLWLPGYEAIPMSIAYYRDSEVWFIVKPVGLTTNTLVNINIGEHVGLIGPLGKPLLLSGNHYLYLAGGSGLAPVIHYIQKTNSRNCKLIYGGWSFEEIGEIPLFLKEIGCSVVTTCLDNKCNYYGTPVEYLSQENLDQYDYIIVCGPREMLKKTIEAIDREYWSKTILIVESMIKCGVGLCGTCRVFRNKKYHLCIDGPGFILSEVGDYFE